jgi:hypothetical protein
MEARGLYNLFALGTNVLSGSAPESDEAFASLEKLGIQTIISVDGTKPNVELARKHGLHYAHLPHGYDGISKELQVQLAKAGQVLPGPIYVHCHHGKHRGPAAAAMICLANDHWTTAQGEAWLLTAGTATNYAGLYDVVRHYQMPTEEELRRAPSTFPEVTEVSGLVDAMVDIDGRWDLLKAVQAAGYVAPADHPDVIPANETVILWEHFREAQRLPEAAKRGHDFLERLKEAEERAKESERLLRLLASDPSVRTRLDAAFDAVAKSCAACHQTYRDPAGIKLRPF